MSNVITLSCPSCGANLEVDSETQEITCKYCGKTHILLAALTDDISAQALYKRNLAQKRLMTFFDFNAVDLEYNRNGKLSPYQEKRFSGEGFMAFFFCLAGGVLGAIVSMFLSPFGEPYFCATLSVMGSMIFGLIGYQQVMRPVASGKIQNKIGTLGKSRFSIWRPTFYIGTVRFPAKGNPFTVLEWNVPYKVYYSPIKNMVLSIEILNS